LGKISSIFLKGLITLLPISLTIFLIIWIASSLENAFGFPLHSMLGELYIPGFGVLLALVLIFVVGLLVNNYLTQKFVAWFGAKLAKAPIIGSIYSPLKDMTQLFARKSEGGHQRVVMIPYQGVEALGLVTRDHFTDLPNGVVAKDSLAVFLPFSYGMGGITVIVPKSSAREVPLPAEKAMQLAITGWIKS
jgi:uncharacterized membrane protein